MPDEIKDEEVIEVEVVAEEPAEKEVSEVEAKAIKLGWTPLEKFKGDPEKWRDATEFVERGENMVPILRATVKRQEKKIEDLDKAMREFAEYHTKAEAAAYTRALKTLKEKQVEAVAVGDIESFEKIDKEIDSLNKVTVPTPKPQNNANDPVYVEWANRNRWVNTDKELLAYAEIQGKFLRETTSLTGADFLDAVAKEVKQRFPAKFSNPRRDAAPAVEAATASAKGGGKTFTDMPKEERDACERMAKNAYSDKPKEMAAFKALFVKTHFEEA